MAASAPLVPSRSSRALATLLAAGRCAWAGRARPSQRRHWAYATGCAATSETSSSVAPGRPTRTNRTGTRYSPTIRTPGIVASASCAVETPPSTEFSIAIIAASDRPSTTSSRASATLRTDFHTPPRASGTCASAASVNVPAGPR